MKGNNKSKSLSKKIAKPTNYAKTFVEKAKILSPCAYPFREMASFNLALQRSKVQLAPLMGNIFDIQDGRANSKKEC